MLKRDSNKRGIFFADDGGFSTLGMVLALLISVSLVIGATQVYKLRSRASDVQNIADACALAAEKHVASFYIVAQVCDSAILSMSLAGIGAIGTGIVLACVPSAQGVSAKLVEAGQSILRARTKFAQTAVEGLNTIQNLLPVFSALGAAQVAQANNRGQAHYMALAVLSPFEGKELESKLADDEALANIEEDREQIAHAAERAEEAASQANEHKRRAWEADCGNSPEYCMHERTEALTGLTGQDNPYYSSVDAWSFSVALHRAQAYYPARLNQEYPASDAPLEQARSAIRRHYYAYASNLIAQAYVYESDENFEAYFPLMPRNTDEMRETSLYYEDVYPITEDEEGFWHMHAWDACPGMEDESFLGYGSVAQWEAEEMDVCEVCEFSASRVGSVASASTNISNGFEYHYQIVAHEAQLYQQERARLAQESRAAKDPVEGVFETLSRLLKEAFDYRIEVYPPGNIGAIALVIDTSLINSASVVPNSLVSSSATLGPRFAVSAASLADDDANEADTVITHLLDGVFQGALASSIPGAALDIWSRFLCVYSSGHTSFLSHIETTLNSLPLLGAAGLGTWAAERLKSFVDDVGLAPPDLVSHKPVLVNSYHVARVDQNSFTSGLLSAKQAIGNAYGGLSQDPLSACVGIAGGMLLTAYDDWDATFVIARIELFGSSGPSIPLEVTLPTSMKGAGRSVIENVLSSLLAQTGQMVEVRRWE